MLCEFRFDLDSPCVTCRTRSEGVFRQSSVEAGVLPLEALARCPYGIPWGKRPVKTLRSELSRWKYEIHRHRGLGDTTAAVLTAFHFKKCDACEQRQVWLNRWVRYPWAKSLERTQLLAPIRGSCLSCREAPSVALTPDQSIEPNEELMTTHASNN